MILNLFLLPLRTILCFTSIEIKWRQHTLLHSAASHDDEMMTPTKINANAIEEPQHSSIVASQGKTALFMLAWPSITTFTLVQGWKNGTTEKLTRSVEEVVRRNPILGGRATMTNFFHTKISIVTGENLDDHFNFVHEIQLDEVASSTISDMKLPSMNETEIIHFMDDFLAPIVPEALSTYESIQNQAALFGVYVIQLPNDYACYVMTMSHCIGDGVTYYNIMDEINREMNQQKRDNELDWSHPYIANHEIFPDRLSPRDVEYSYGFPFFLGLLKNAVNMKKQEMSYIFLDKHKIDVKKQELSGLGEGHLSDNDVITAALCAANLSSDMFAFAMNMRDRHSHFGGNFHNEIPFAKDQALDPRAFRNIVKKGFYYDTNELPICPFVLGKVGRISSLASVQKIIKSSDMESIICHTMLSSFVHNVPLDTAFIISMNEDTYVIPHNFRDIDLDQGLINELQCQDDNTRMAGEATQEIR